MEEKKEYYFDEEGNLVMTEAFHKKRGFCCGNSCRHCPYTKPTVRGNQELRKDR